MAERITRKELKKPDEFFALAQRALQWIFTNRRTLIAGLVVVVLAILASSGWKWYQLNKEKKASILFIEAKKALEDDAKADPTEKGDQTEKYQTALTKLSQISKDFGSTNTAVVSSYFIGEIHLKSEKYEEARKNFKDYLDKTDQQSEMAIYALEGIGISYENEGKLQQASDYFRRMTEPPYDQEPDRGMYHLARLQEKDGKPVEAKNTYQQILAKHPNTIFAQEIQQRLAALEIAAASTQDDPKPEAKPQQSEQSESAPAKATEDRG